MKYFISTKGKYKFKIENIKNTKKRKKIALRAFCQAP
jgi:hypothetical protein